MQSKFEAIDALKNWDTNYEAGRGPMALFLDLVGYSEEQGMDPLFDLKNNVLGYLELDYLADALKIYAQVGQEAHDYVTNLMNMEANA